LTVLLFRFSMKMEHLPYDESGTTFGDLIYQKYPNLKGKMNHIHHAGNSSGVVDGAAAVLLTSESYMKDNNMTPRGRIVATANIGEP